MLKLSTSTKIFCAKALSRAVRTARLLVGKGNPVCVTSRHGITWELDLREGIDLAIYLFGYFERSTVAALKSLIKPGMTVIDIGANVGAHTLPLAERVGETGRVVAVEPTDWAFAKLERNLSLNPHLKSRVTALQAALMSHSKEIQSEFYASWKLDGAKEVHQVHQGSLCSAEGAEFLTLDELVNFLKLDKVDVIKLDVDGNECKVLRGAEQTLSRWHPVIVSELSPEVHSDKGESFEALIAQLNRHGYQLFEDAGNKRLPSDVPSLLRHIPERGGINVVAVAG